MKSRFILRFVLYFAVPITIAFLVYKYVGSRLLAPINISDNTQVLVDIKPASSFASICRKLEQKGLIKHWRVLDIIGRLKGKSVQIKAGEYVFRKSMSPTAIFAHLSSGQDYKRTFKVVPGMNINSITLMIRHAGINGPNSFKVATSDPSLLVRAGLQTKSFEGYLGVGEYSFSKNAEMQNIIWELFEKADKAWTLSHQQRAQALNVSRNEVLTIASLLQKEVTKANQYNLFAGLIINRLKTQRKLELQSTLRYILGNYSGEISEAMKGNRNPYNTFYFPGLPPGPICIPSEQAVEAALNPAKHDFQEFVRRPDGTLILK